MEESSCRQHDQVGGSKGLNRKGDGAVDNPVLVLQNLLLSTLNKLCYYCFTLMVYRLGVL